MFHVTLNPNAARNATMGEVVTFVESIEPGAIPIPRKLAIKYALAIKDEDELRETLRTGLPRKVRGK